MTLSYPAIGFISLGCPKNLVDSERILTELRSQGYRIVPHYADAELVIVNTCGFIDSAVEESLATIQEALNENGQVIVTGCLGVKEERIRALYPNVLEISGPHSYERVIEQVNLHLPRPAFDPYTSLIPKQNIKLTPKHYAYLKISEGCDHHCTFCIIPSLRGKLESRSVDTILDEAHRLVQNGVKEILIIAQDTSAYGTDIQHRTGFWQGMPVRSDLVSLCNQLSKLNIWIRLHYVYPYPNVDALIPLMADGKILPYLDMPLQHASSTILKSMKRPGSIERTLERIQKWRSICPDLTLRSTFIVGYPGETKTDFERLLTFLQDAQLDRVGAFTYSPVDGAVANQFENPVPETVKRERYERFMQLQQTISENKLKQKIGSIVPVIIDECRENTHIELGRTMSDAPDIDGVVHIKGNISLRHLGEIVPIKITDSDAYDLWGEPVG